MKLNVFLKTSRLYENKTQKEMCESIGVSFVTYNKLEKNDFEPSIKVIKKICDYFKLDGKTIREML